MVIRTSISPLEGDDSIYDVALPGLVDIVRYHVGDEVALSYVKDSEGEGDACSVRRVTALGGKRAEVEALADDDAAPVEEPPASSHLVHLGYVPNCIMHKLSLLSHRIT